MSNVVNFTKPEDPKDRVWTCADCGCQTFRLYQDGSTECALCNRRGTDSEGGWIDHLTESKDFDDTIPTRSNVEHGSTHFAQESIKRRIDEHTALIVVAQDDGAIKMWSVVGEHDNKPRRKWLKRILKGAIGLALGLPVKDSRDNSDLPPETEKPVSKSE